MDGSYEGTNKTILQFDGVPLHIVTRVNTGENLMLEEDLANLLGYRGTATRHLERGVDYLTLRNVPIRAYPVEEGEDPVVRRTCKVVTERGYIRLTGQRRVRAPETVDWLDSMLRKSGMFLYIGWYEANGPDEVEVETPDADAPDYREPSGNPEVEVDAEPSDPIPMEGPAGPDGEGTVPLPSVSRSCSVTVDGFPTTIYCVDLPQSGQAESVRVIRTARHVAYPVEDVAPLLREDPAGIPDLTGPDGTWSVGVEYPNGMGEAWTVIGSSALYWLLRVREGLHLQLGQPMEAERLRRIRVALDQLTVPLSWGVGPCPGIGGPDDRSASVSDVLSDSVRGLARALRMIADGEGTPSASAAELLLPLVDEVSRDGRDSGDSDGLRSELDRLRNECARLRADRERLLSDLDGVVIGIRPADDESR